MDFSRFINGPMSFVNFNQNYNSPSSSSESNSDDEAPIDSDKNDCLFFDPTVRKNVPYNKFPSESEKITIEKVCDIEKMLDLMEVISLVFLLYDSKLALQTIITILKSSQSEHYVSDKISEWARSEPSDWQSKLLEALTIIYNYQVINKMGITCEEVNERFLPRDSTTLFLPRLKKMLYRLSENMIPAEGKLIITKVRSDDKFKALNVKDITLNFEGFEKYFELFILFWANINYIDIDEDSRHLDLDNLTKHFETKSLSENVLLKETVKEINSVVSDKKKETGYPVKETKEYGLVLIVNNKEFEGNKDLDTRIGTECDAENIKKTFTNIRYKVRVVNNICSKNFSTQVESLLLEHFEEYHSVLFLCVLSHGIPGAVYCSDGVSITIDDVINSVCECKIAKTRLANKPKVFIIQACQGDEKLFVETKVKKLPQRSNVPATSKKNFSFDSTASSSLAFDGVTEFPRPKSDLLVCMAIIKGCVAVRCPKKGTIYIEELCKKIGENYNKRHFSDIVTLVHGELNKRILHVSDPEGSGNCKDHKKCMAIYMQPEILYYRLGRPLYLVPKSYLRL